MLLLHLMLLHLMNLLNLNLHWLDNITTSVEIINKHF